MNEEAHREASSEYGKRAAGVPKVFTPEERARRAEQMRKMNTERAEARKVAVASGKVTLIETSRGVVRRSK